MYNSRTYSNKSSKRKHQQRGQDNGSDRDESVPAPEPKNTTKSPVKPSPGRVRKRQKVEVEIVHPLTTQESRLATKSKVVSGQVGPSRSQSLSKQVVSRAVQQPGSETNVSKSSSSKPRASARVRSEPSTDIENDSDHGTPAAVAQSRPKPHITYSSPRKSSSSHSIPGPSVISPEPAKPASPTPLTPKRPARDLSQLFDSNISSSRDPSPSPSPNKLAKRMLSRSRTESSLGGKSASSSFSASHASSSSLGLARNISLPKPLTSSKSFSALPKKSNTASLEPPSADINPLPAIPAPITHARTYAGKSRSFLVSLPASHLSSHSTTDTPADQADEDGFAIRESYTSLRTRWGVDNSEDDPYPQIPSLASSNASPGKGKGKAKVLPNSASGVLPLPHGMMNDLKSITELRSKGESRRFLDEVGYLFEGMDPVGGLGLRRASALEIVTKFCDADFTRKAKAADFYGRTWDVLREAGAGNGDKILDTILIFFIALVARDPTSLTDLAQRSSSSASPSASPASPFRATADVTSTLFTILHSLTPSTDTLALISSGLSDAELKKAGVAKNEKPMLVTLHNTISTRSGLFPSDTSLSARLLISHTLLVLPPSFLSATLLPSLLVTLKHALESLPIRFNAYLSGLSLFPSPTDTPPFAHVGNCLRLLDSFLLGQWSQSSKFTADGGNDSLGDTEKANSEALESARDDWLADGLVALGVVSEIILTQPQSHSQGLQKTAQKCTEMAFRVLMSLTNENPVWCHTVVHHEFALSLIMRTVVRSHYQRQRRSIPVPQPEDKGKGKIKQESVAVEADEGGSEHETIEDAQALDRLYLALALLTNLVQVAEETKEKLRKTCLDQACAFKRSCIRTCNCARPISALNILALLYVHHLKSENDNDDIDPEGDFLRGHLAILLGLLMRGNSLNQSTILAALPGPSNKMKLGRLVDQAREFVSFYAELTVRLQKAAGRGNRAGVDSDVDEQESVAGDDRRMEGVDEKGGDIARDVITFLEELRDEPGQR